MRDLKKKKNTAVRGIIDWRYFLFFFLGITVATLFFIFSGSNLPGLKSIIETPDSSTNWQKWEYTTIKLERPDDTFPPMDIKPLDILWIFEQKTASDVEQLIKSCNLDPVLEKSLLDKSRWKIELSGTMVSPTPEAVKNLPLEARQKIYSVLRNNPANFFHYNPFRLSADDVDDWLSNSGLSPENQMLFRHISWKEGNVILFYDFQLFEHIVKNPQEKRAVAKSLSQIPALLMNLKITPQTDIDTVVKYFKKGGSGPEMRSFLESLKKLPNGKSISVSFLLPSFAKIRLYTYSKYQEGKKPYDCFYSAMNFFNNTPDDRFLDGDYIQQVLHSQYYNVGTNYTYGDLIMLIEEDNKAIHMCVYIADDVVFTKNGAQDLQPWILMKLPDMLKIYQTNKPLKIVAYRKRD